MRPRLSSQRRTGLVLGPLLVVALALVGCTAEGDRQERPPVRDEDGQVLDSTEIEALRVQVGDCFNGEIPFALASIDAVPCSQPHDHEVYAVFDIDPTPEPADADPTASSDDQDETTTTVDLDEEFPGEARVQELGERGCLVAFGGYVGAPYETSALEIALILPTRESWETIGDREAVCTVHRADGAQLEGSVRDSGL